MGSWLNPTGPVYEGPDPLDLGGEDSTGDDAADFVTGDDPNDDFDGGQWFNSVMPGTPAAAAEEFGGPQQSEDWEEDSNNPWDVTQEESENTIAEFTQDLSQDLLGFDRQTVKWLVIGGAALYLLAPLLQIGAGVADS